MRTVTTDTKPEEPAWLDLAEEQLERLTEPQRRKKRRTIIALVDAELAGNSDESVWKLPGTCSRRIYHAKWKREPVFAAVLDAVMRLAFQENDRRILRALGAAAGKLALNAPDAVDNLVALMDSGDESIVYRASVAILDRAGLETGVKTPGQTTIVLNWGESGDEPDDTTAETA